MSVAFELMTAGFSSKPAPNLVAANRFETILAVSLARERPGWQQPGWDLAKQRFFFRAAFLPAVFMSIIRGWSEKQQAPLLGLGDLAAYAVASRRICLEFYFRHQRQASAGKPASKEAKPPGAPAGKRLLDWFEAASEGYGFWLRRFEAYRQAAEQSWRHFMKKKCPALLSLEPGARLAAFAAVNGKLKWFPDGILEELVRQFPSGPNQAAGKLLYPSQISRPTYSSVKRHNVWKEELDGWLIEVWPLAQEYNWTYRQVSNLYGLKFNTPSMDRASFGKPSQIEDRCKKTLGLFLSKQAQRNKNWRRMPVYPFFYPLGLGIQPIGADPKKWLQGEFPGALYFKDYYGDSEVSRLSGFFKLMQ